MKSILIKELFPEKYLSDSLVVVGSSDSLLKEKRGKLIDSFGEVVRFNRAPVNGFEDSIGAKTTFRIMNTHAFANKEFAYPEHRPYQPTYFTKTLKNTNICISHVVPNEKSEEWRDKENHTDPSSNVFFFDRNSVMPFIKESMGMVLNKEISSGLSFLLLCCKNGIVPNVIGFTFEKTDKLYHYWSPNLPLTTSCHSFDIEAVIAVKLIEKGLIKVL